MNALLDLARPEIRDLVAYQAASPGRDMVRLHANESQWRHGFDGTAPGLNLYPDPRPRELVEGLADTFGVPSDSLLLTRGSDDAIDVLVRAYCAAGRDAILVSPPTFGMYAVAARIQGADVVEAPLAGDDFRLDVDAVLEVWRPGVKLVFVCSPNNPTGTQADPLAVRRLCESLAGRALVVVDEAYIEFSTRPGVTPLRREYPNLVVLRTLSKAWALAGARLGALLGDPALVSLLRAVLPPYPLPTPTVEAGLAALAPDVQSAVAAERDGVRARRGVLAKRLEATPGIRRVIEGEGNFVLVESADPDALVAACRDRGILVRDFSRYPRLAGCVRITVGTAEQIDAMLEALERSRAA